MNASSRPDAEDVRAVKVRHFAKLVTAGMIILCNCVLLFGVWVSGVNLDELMKSPDLFDSQKDVCLRLTWQRINGAPDPVRVCSEWINLADPSGVPHQLAKDIKVRQGPDGKYYFDRRIQADFRLLGLALFVGAVLSIGMWLRHRLVARYRLRLAVAEAHGSIGLH
jgi:hypothetical protein